MIRLCQLLDMQIRYCLPLFLLPSVGHKVKTFIFNSLSLEISRKRKEENVKGKSAVPVRRSSCALRCADRANSKPWKRVQPSLIRQEEHQELPVWSTLLTLGTTKTTTTT